MISRYDPDLLYFTYQDGEERIEDTFVRVHLRVDKNAPCDPEKDPVVIVFSDNTDGIGRYYASLFLMMIAVDLQSEVAEPKNMGTSLVEHLSRLLVHNQKGEAVNIATAVFGRFLSQISLLKKQASSMEATIDRLRAELAEKR